MARKPQSVSAFGYLVLEVSDLDRWEHLATNVLGLQISRKVAGEFIALRMDRYENRLILVKGSADDVKAFGWEVQTEEDLEAIVRRIQAAGIEVKASTPEEAADRFVRKFYRCKDYEGNTFEIYYAPRVTNRPYLSQVVEHGYVTGQLGMGHYVPVSKGDHDKTLFFYKELLGMSMSDHVREKFPQGFTADVAFMHCNPRHHTIAAFQFPQWKKSIHHFMIEVKDLQDFGRIHDRCREGDYPLMMTIGGHPNSQALSFYIESPSGFGVEISYGGVLIGPDWTVRDYDFLNSWGHHSTKGH